MKFSELTNFLQFHIIEATCPDLKRILKNLLLAIVTNALARSIFLELIHRIHFFRKDWSDPQTFLYLRSIINQVPGRETILYSSNILACTYFDLAASGLNQGRVSREYRRILINIARLRPTVAVYTDGVVLEGSGMRPKTVYYINQRNCSGIPVEVFHMLSAPEHPDKFDEFFWKFLMCDFLSHCRGELLERPDIPIQNLYLTREY